jgi:hypothetical protein
MPKPKKPVYKLLVGKLLSSDRLSSAERLAFEKISNELKNGTEPTEHQKLWIDTLRHKLDL